MFNSSNHAFLLVQKVQISPECEITLGVKAKKEMIFSICPKLLINVNFMGPCVGPKAEEKDTIKFGKPKFATLVANVVCSIY